MGKTGKTEASGAPWLTSVSDDQRRADDEIRCSIKQQVGAVAEGTDLATLPPETMLDAERLANLLGCCKVSVQRAMRRGELPAPFKFGGRFVWLASAIREHLQRMQAEVRDAAQRRGGRILKHSA